MDLYPCYLREFLAKIFYVYLTSDIYTILALFNLPPSSSTTSFPSRSTLSG